jgi:hypothetical protein
MGDQGNVIERGTFWPSSIEKLPYCQRALQKGDASAALVPLRQYLLYDARSGSQ